MKNDYDVIKQAHYIVENYAKRTQIKAYQTQQKLSQKTPPTKNTAEKKPHEISITPFIVTALIFAILCVINILMWFFV